MQYLLLARHGNTFAPGQKVVWVGARNDLPLVESGLAQAHSLAQALKASSLLPEIIYAASLQRTSVYAQILHDELSLSEPIHVDSRLHEIDYGNWSGLNEAEIKEKFGAHELQQWNDQGEWPKSFNGSDVDIENEIRDFVQDTIINRPKTKIALAVTSNGRLKYFLKLIPDAYRQYIEQSKWKVSTGKLCILAYKNNAWQIISWNESPQYVTEEI